MTRYRTIKTLTLAAGTVVQLSAAQALNRLARIEPLGEGRYRLKELQQFKGGEVLGIEGSLPKVHLEMVEELKEQESEGPVKVPVYGKAKK